jgi:hypothetical protein
LRFHNRSGQESTRSDPGVPEGCIYSDPWHDQRVSPWLIRPGPESEEEEHHPGIGHGARCGPTMFTKQVSRRWTVWILKGALIPIGGLTSRFPHGSFSLARNRGGARETSRWRSCRPPERFERNADLSPDRSPRFGDAFLPPSGGETWGPVSPDNVHETGVWAPCTAWIRRRGGRGRASRANSKKDLVTGRIQAFHALQAGVARQ